MLSERDLEIAREELRAAVISMERAREADGDAATAIPGWPRRGSGNWSVLDHFDREGRLYVVARRCEPLDLEPPRLTERELEILRRASLEATNKVIAYDLGLAPSTVRVLLHRAASKLGARCRDELIARFRELPSE